MASRRVTHPARSGAAAPTCSVSCSSLVLAAWLLLAVAGCSPSPQAGSEQVTIAGETWTFEVARDTPSRTRGLGGRASLPPQGGMMFIFPDAQVRSFWMYDCLMPIDVVFLDPLGVITATHSMPIEPPRAPEESEATYAGRLPLYSSRFPAQFALEFPAGTIERLGLRPNTRIDLDPRRLKSLAR